VDTIIFVGLVYTAVRQNLILAVSGRDPQRYHCCPSQDVTHPPQHREDQAPPKLRTRCVGCVHPTALSQKDSNTCFITPGSTHKNSNFPVSGLDAPCFHASLISSRLHCFPASETIGNEMNQHKIFESSPFSPVYYTRYPIYLSLVLAPKYRRSRSALNYCQTHTHHNSIRWLRRSFWFVRPSFRLFTCSASCFWGDVMVQCSPCYKT